MDTSGHSRSKGAFKEQDVSVGNLQKNETDACSAETKSSGAWHSAWPSPLGGPFHGIVREWTAFDHKGGKVFKITDGDGDELVLAASLKDCETWLDNVERGVS